MEYLEATGDFSGCPRPHVFLAGGIAGCPDWQSEIVGLLQSCTQGTLLNPRRSNFPIHDPAAAQEQITWEHHALWQAEIVTMWFADSTLQPICMFELGTLLARHHLKHSPLGVLIVGSDPNYARIQDVRIQTALVDPSIPIRTSLADHADAIRRAVEAL